MKGLPFRLLRFAIGLAATISVAVAAESASEGSWWEPGEGRVFPEMLNYPNEHGILGLMLQDGPMETAGHPFFEPLGPYGRACVTCHQPADGMSISAETARERWELLGAKEPLFAAFDGSNCPDLPQEKRESHSLLLDYGLIRVARPWPPVNYYGETVEPDYSIEVVRDPTSCNLSPKWGLQSDKPHVSVFRRPRPVSNIKYILAIGFPWDPKTGRALPVDRETGKPTSHNLMHDGRALTLKTQMLDAAATHLGFTNKLTDDDIERIEDFEKRIFVAQQFSNEGGAVDSGGAKGGPRMLMESPAGRLGAQGIPVWSEFEVWANADKDDSLTPEQQAWRQSVARGAKNFRERTFLITDSNGITSPVGFGSPVRNACVFCHNMSQMGMDVAPGQVDLGTTVLPFAESQPHLPLFRITCLKEPHPHYGKVIHTYDPGYALTTGKCADVGRITLQSNRGLTARPPYFSNGSAKTLRDVILYYDRRYNIGYSAQEIEDLVNLLEAL